MKIGTVKAGDKVVVNDLPHTQIYDVEEVIDGRTCQLTYRLHDGRIVSAGQPVDVCMLRKPTKLQIKNYGTTP